jgi:hypothetical protein
MKSNISPLKEGCIYWKIISPLGEEYQPTFLWGGGYMKKGREKRGKCEEKRRKDKR